MAGFIGEDILGRILLSVDIVEVISRYLPLKKAGRNFKACCPFHAEKTPSFMVSSEKQIFKCFGCGKGGNVFHFLMEQEHVGFVEAVRMMAEKAGVEIPVDSRESASAFKKEDMFRAVNFAMELYHRCLVDSDDGKVGRQYLQNRGITEATIKKFKLGFASAGWETLLRAAVKKGLGEKLLLEVGLIIRKERGGCYDRFHNRVLFPIFDVQGRVVGFSGRVLEQGEPKYLNSPETPLFSKSRILFGLNFTREEILSKKKAVICEGHIDFLTAYQGGIHNIVAVQGTAFTDQQARLLKRYTDEVVFAFDSDMAGEKAVLRSFDALVGAELEVKIALMPSGYDPDLLIREFGPGRFEEVLDAGVGLFDFYLEVVSRDKDLGRTADKVAIAEEVGGFIKKVPREITRNEYIQRLSQRLDIPEETLRNDIKRTRGGYGRLGDHKKAEEHFGSLRRSAEEGLIRYMLYNPEVLQNARKRLAPEDFRQSHCQALVRRIFESEIDAGEKLVEGLLKGATDITQSELLTCGVDWKCEEEKVSRAGEDLINKILMPERVRRKQELMELIAGAGKDSEKVSELQSELERLAGAFKNA